MELDGRIKEIVKKGEELSGRLECDGSTRVLNYLLSKEGIPHDVYIGEVTYEGQVIPIHYWIRIGEWYIDNKSRMGFGDSVPQGIFKRSPVFYDGEHVLMETTDTIFHILTLGTETYWIELNK